MGLGHKSMTDLGAREYPLPAHCNHPIPPKGEREKMRNTWEIHSPQA